MDIKKKSVIIPYLLYSVVFGLIFAFTSVFSPDSAEAFSPIKFIIGFILGLALLLFNTYLAGIKYNKEIPLSNKKYFLISFFSIMLVSIVFWIVYFPGTASNDTIVMIRGGMGVSKQHPWMYILILRVLEKIVHILGGTTYHVFIIFTFLQILVVATFFSSCLVWLKSKSVPAPFLIIIHLIYMLCPIFNLYTVSVIKDMPFSLGLMIMLPLLYELTSSKGEIIQNKKFMVILMLATILLFFRSNGSMIALFMSVVFLIIYRQYFKQFVLYLLFTVILICGTKFVQSHTSTGYKFQEAVGVPIQQMAAVVAADRELTPSQEDFLSQLIPLETIKEKFDPYNVDSIKYSSDFADDTFVNAHKNDLIKTWLDMMIDNPGIYIDEHLRTTYGFWSMSNSSFKMRYTYIGAFADPSEFDDWFADEKIVQKNLLPAKIQEPVEFFLTSISVFLGVGTVFWIFIGMMISLIVLKDKKIWLIGLPVILCFLTLILATPIAFQWRYGLGIVYSLPLLYGIAMIGKNN